MNNLSIYFNELVRSRRSVFPNQFIPGKKIDDEIVNEILVNATWAPDHGREQPWQFTVFAEEGLQALASFQSELYKQESGEKFKELTYQKLQQTPLSASHIIAIGMKRTTTKQIPEWEDVAAVACAVQNVYLSVAAYGLGGYWTSGGITNYAAAKSYFGLGENDKLLGFFYMGHIAVPSATTARKPVTEKVTWIKE